MKKVFILLISLMLLSVGGGSTSARAAAVENYYVDLQVPETGLVLPATLITSVENSQDLQYAIDNAHIAIFKINKDLQVTYDSTGNTTLANVYSQIKGKVIPAIYVSDQATVNSAVAFLQSNTVKDVYIVSDNGIILKGLRTNYKVSRSVLDLSKSNISLKEMFIKINESGCNTAILPNNMVTKDAITYLRQRYITTWANAANFNKTQNAELIIKGINGIIADDLQAVKQVMTDSFKDVSLVREAAIVGHRGNPSAKTPENSMSSFKRAYDNGATMIELDIQFTKDKQLLIMHDTDLQRTTGKAGVVSSLTLAQIRSGYTLKGEQIPILEDVLEEFANKDVMIVIEIKYYAEGIEQKMIDVLEEKHAEDKVTVISFDHNSLKTVKNLKPSLSLGKLTSDAIGADIPRVNVDTSLGMLYNFVGDIGASYDPNKASFNKNIYLQAGLRGITYSNWTYGNNEKMILNRHIMSGVYALTTDFAEWVTNDVKSIASKNAYSMNKGDVFSETLQGITYGRNQVLIKDYLPIIIDGTDIVAVEDGKLTAKKGGTASVMFAYKVLTPDMVTTNPQYYQIYTSPCTITVHGSDNETDPPHTDGDPIIGDPIVEDGCSGCGSNSASTMLFISLLFIGLAKIIKLF